MMNYRMGRRKSLSSAWAAVLVGVGESPEMLFWPEQGVFATVLISAILALAVIVGIVWLRVRASRRWNAALEAYADREITRARRRNEANRERLLPPGRLPSPDHRIAQTALLRKLNQPKRTYSRRNRHARPQSQGR
jgi:hypothetical protein